MIVPSDDEVTRAADMLARLAANGNPRPGDGWLGKENQRRQFQVRALDMLTIMKNAPAILDSYGLPAATRPARWPIALAFGLAVLAVVVAFAWGTAYGIATGFGG